MSRTFRFIATWQVPVTDWDKTEVGIDPIGQAWRLNWNDRHRHENGYDSHRARSCVSNGFDKEDYSGKSRKIAKSYYHRKRRRADRKLIQEWLETPETQGVDSIFRSA